MGIWNQMVQREPWLERDRAMIDQLRTIGIQKGKAFDPDARTQELLGAAIQEAHAWLDGSYEALFVPFNEGSRWAVPAASELVKSFESFFQVPDAYPVDAAAWPIPLPSSAPSTWAQASST